MADSTLLAMQIRVGSREMGDHDARPTANDWWDARAVLRRRLRP